MSSVSASAPWWRRRSWAVRAAAARRRSSSQVSSSAVDGHHPHDGVGQVGVDGVRGLRPAPRTGRRPGPGGSVSLPMRASASNSEARRAVVRSVSPGTRVSPRRWRAGPSEGPDPALERVLLASPATRCRLPSTPMIRCQTERSSSAARLRIRPRTRATEPRPASSERPLVLDEAVALERRQVGQRLGGHRGQVVVGQLDPVEAVALVVADDPVGGLARAATVAWCSVEQDPVQRRARRRGRRARPRAPSGAPRRAALTPAAASGAKREAVLA